MSAVRGIALAIAAALVAMFSSASSAFAQDDPVSLTPLGDWQVARGEDSCTITRKFGDPLQPTTLILRSYDPWDGGFQLGVASTQYEFTGDPFSAGWLPDGIFITIKRSNKEIADEVPAIFFRHGLWDTNMPKADTAEHAAYWARDENDEPVGPLNFKRSVERFVIEGAYARTLAFETGSMDRVVATREACIEQMLIAKGIDLADEASGDHPIKMTNHDSLGQKIFSRMPENLAISDAAKLVSFFLYLSSDAEITACRLIAMPHDENFEEYGCGVLKAEANFEFQDGEMPRTVFYEMSGSFAR